jgi:glycosyltransferase involved in cell wall biosynthesis
MNALLSGLIPVQIICCADSSRQTHAAIGYDQEKMVVISNGFDIARFLPDVGARTSVRTELGLSPDTLLIGLCARFNPQKDHETFIRAAGLLSRKMPQVHFLLWGDYVDVANDRLTGWIATENLKGRTHLLGMRPDSPRLAAALDVSTLSSSYGEAFPLVVGEAMSCAVPCVVTDVGDAAHIVGETGRSVPPSSPEALAAAWVELLSLPADERRALGNEARKRIENLFSLEKMGEAYAQLYRDIIGDADRADP